MYLKKEMMVTLLLVLVLSVVSPGEIKAKNGNASEVDDVYQGLRTSSPLYQWDESIVTFENEGMILVCSLTIPRAQQLCPIVITLNGFAGDRNDWVINGTDEPYFKRVARLLAEHGFASLRVDFRGSGESDGQYQMTTFSTQVSDIHAAVDYICYNLRHQVNTKAIGILGLSQGGLVGALVASKDRRVSSLALWSPVASPDKCYGGLLTDEGLKRGLALPDGGYDMFGLYINGEYLNWDIPLGKGFFQDLFNVDPVAEIRKFKGPMMVIVGQNDPIIWPQPTNGKLYLKYHEGNEKLVVLDADHDFNSWEGPEKIDDAIYWSTAWFIKTLK